ncbi:MAG: prephenate dehydrogenase/arogenate dehydrogenase family protein [Anaerolineae bacterium]|jgi:prephenate dehydrogenase|nr:prephenate dehydrogenase/arogenate dehydrogenase family protein [Anaerolineae bacterium]
MSKAKVALVGCDFVGMSLGMAIKRALGEVEVVGHDKDRDAMRRAENAKAIDRGEWNLPNACDRAAAIFISGAPDELSVTLRAIAPDLGPNTLVVAVGGPNVVALKTAEGLLAEHVPFFSTALIYHPDRVNGTPDLPDADSIRDAIWTVVPSHGASTEMVDMFVALANQLGAKPIFVDPVERDGMSVAVDAMPAVISSMLMLAVSGDAAWRDREWMAGAAFGQAVSGVEHAHKFAAVLSAQPDVAVHWLNQIVLQCIALRDAIAARNAEAVERALVQAEEKRQQWLADWRKGRVEGHIPIERDTGGLLKIFLGERMASRIAGNKKR